MWTKEEISLIKVDEKKKAKKETIQKKPIEVSVIFVQVLICLVVFGAAITMKTINPTGFMPLAEKYSGFLSTGADTTSNGSLYRFASVKLNDIKKAIADSKDNIF